MTLSPKRSRSTRAHIADRVDQPELEPAPAGPVLAGEQVFFRAGQLAAAARLHQRDEILVDFPLQLLQPFDVIRVSPAGTGRASPCVRPRYKARRSMPSLAISLVEPERAADHADRADDRDGSADDLVGGAGEHVAARGRDILDERDDPALLLLRQFADAAEDQMRLHGRAARRIDRRAPPRPHCERRKASRACARRRAIVRPGRSGVEIPMMPGAAPPAPRHGRRGNAAAMSREAPRGRA